jgi:hypothetical protein
MPFFIPEPPETALPTCTCDATGIAAELLLVLIPGAISGVAAPPGSLLSPLSFPFTPTTLLAPTVVFVIPIPPLISPELNPRLYG